MICLGWFSRVGLGLMIFHSLKNNVSNNNNNNNKIRFKSFFFNLV